MGRRGNPRRDDHGGRRLRTRARACRIQVLQLAGTDAQLWLLGPQLVEHRRLSAQPVGQQLVVLREHDGDDVLTQSETSGEPGPSWPWLPTAASGSPKAELQLAPPGVAAPLPSCYGAIEGSVSQFATSSSLTG